MILCTLVSNLGYSFNVVPLLQFRCAQGYKPRDNTCINDNECMWLPCINGGICKDHEPPLRYVCLCPEDYTGIHCELELARSGAIKPSRDFILAVIVCLTLLLGKFEAFDRKYSHDK